MEDDRAAKQVYLGPPTGPVGRSRRVTKDLTVLYVSMIGIGKRPMAYFEVGGQDSLLVAEQAK